MLRYVTRSAGRTWFPRPDDMPKALHELLMDRGIDSAEAAERFLHPDRRSLLNPFLLSDMDQAARRVLAAARAGETICVYGDYDVDGVCASSILSEWLKAHGADARVYLPSRHSEGYGLNENAVREIAGWARLMVTVDCGITSVELVALAKSLGLDVVVTDHHRPADALPDCPVVNPLLKDYPFPALCGAGVAWKLIWAMSLLRHEGDPAAEADAMAYVDIAALPTVADVVSLTGENRAIVKLGLDAINARPRPGIAALIEAAGLSGKPITSTAVAFQLAPRLNAGGRLGSAERSQRLIVAPDAATARPLAEALEQENANRRQIEKDVLDEAEKQLKSFPFAEHRALILAGKDWNAGVIGLAASRLVEKYHYPVILLADQGDRLTGSCRSIEGVDIHAALTGCAHTIAKFGGHRQAAGLTLLPEQLEPFRAAMDDWLFRNIDPNAYIPVREYDGELSLEDITPAMIAALEALQPTGFGNPAPVFRTTAELVDARAVGAEGAHLKLTLSQDGRRMGGIAFREGPRAQTLPARLDVLFVPKLNTFMGRTEAQLEVRALADADVNARIAAKLSQSPPLQCDFLTEVFYNRKIAPLTYEPDAIDPDELADWLRATPQGTLILTADLAMAARLCRLFGPDAPDLYFGALPDDPRCFNALCVCPPVRPIDPGYHRIVLAGIPSEVLTDSPGAPGCYLDDDPAWLRCLPDLEYLRDAYRAMMALSRRPSLIDGPTRLAMAVAEEAGMDPITAAAAVPALLDMGLFHVTYEGGAATIERRGAAKVAPETSEVWKIIQRWRTGDIIMF